MAGPNARILTAAARATALCRVRTGLDRPGDRCNLIAFAGYAEDVARDAGDVSACLELNFVRAAGNALVAHVEGCILGKIEARLLHCGAGVLECAVGADLKVDGILRGSGLGVGGNGPGVHGVDLHVGDMDAVGRMIVDGGRVF